MQNASIRSAIIKADPIQNLNHEQKATNIGIEQKADPQPQKVPTQEDTSGENKKILEAARVPQLTSLQVSLVAVGNDNFQTPKKADSMSILDQSLKSVPVSNTLGLAKSIETPAPSPNQSPHEQLENQSISNSSAAGHHSNTPKEKEKPQAAPAPKFMALKYEQLYATVFYQQKLSRWVGHSIEYDDKHFKNHQANHVDASMVLSSVSRNN